LNRIALRVDPAHSAADCLMDSASTTNGFSLREVAGLAKRSGLDFQMAFRHAGADFIVPSVVHWKVGHYAALVRQEGDRYLLEDPTFVNTVWATREALESEVSGYFLVPAGKLPAGWPGVATQRGEKFGGRDKPRVTIRISTRAVIRRPHLAARLVARGWRFRACI